jgi:hypothetical protein
MGDYKIGGLIGDKRELDGMNVGGAFMANNVEQKPIKLFGEDDVRLTPAQQSQSIFC